MVTIYLCSFAVSNSIQKTKIRLAILRISTPWHRHKLRGRAKCARSKCARIKRVPSQTCTNLLKQKLFRRGGATRAGNNDRVTHLRVDFGCKLNHGHITTTFWGLLKIPTARYNKTQNVSHTMRCRLIFHYIYILKQRKRLLRDVSTQFTCYDRARNWRPLGSVLVVCGQNRGCKPPYDLPLGAGGRVHLRSQIKWVAPKCLCAQTTILRASYAKHMRDDLSKTNLIDRI